MICQDVYFSGNKKIDKLINEMHLKVKNHDGMIAFEWIPFNQLSSIEEIGKGDYATVYSAIWKDGPLYYDSKKEYTRKSYEYVALKCIHNSQNITNESLNNEV